MMNSRFPGALGRRDLPGLIFLTLALVSWSGDAGAATTRTTAHARSYAYLANFGDRSVSTYVIDPATGHLKGIGKAAVGTSPFSVSVDPSGKYVYAANFRSNSVSQYTIGPHGRLEPMSPATVATGTQPGFVAVNPSDKYAYVANESGTVSQYTIGPHGRLEPMSPGKVATGSKPVAIAIAPSGKYAYVANFGATVTDDGNLSQYRIGSDGTLSPMSPPTISAGAKPISVTVDPSGHYAYVANYYSDTVSQYIIGPHGSLTQMRSATVATGTNPRSICTTGPWK